MSNPFTTKDPLFDVVAQVLLGEKKLTDAELKKREEIVLAIKRENPDMEKSRAYAIATAQAKKVAEEAELDEASAQARQNKDKKGELEAQRGLKNLKDTGRLNYDTNTRDAATREGRKLAKEEVDQIDEISDKTLGNYVSKAVVDVHNDAKFAGESGSKDASKKAFKRLLGVKSAAARLSKQNVSGGRISNYRAEEVNLDEQLENFWEAYTTMFNEAEDQQQNMLLRAMAKDPSDLMKMKRAIKMGDKALTNPALRQEILAMLDKMMNLTTADPSLLQRTKMGFQKAKMKMPEEVELDEANKSSPTHYHSANLRHKQKQKLTSDHVVTSTGHVVHKSTGKVVGHVKKDSVVRRRHGGLASYDKDTHGQIPATHKPATPKPAATTDNKDDGPLGRTILSYPKPKRTLGEALVAIGDKPRPKPAATHIVDKPGHPLHGKPVSVLGGAGRVYGTRTAGMAVHHDGKNHIVSQQHLKPIPKSEGDSKPKSTLGEAIGAKDKQDEGEYGYEGDMAMSQLRTIIRNCQEMMKVLDKETDLPEWVQSKITLATDYLQTANDYLMSELEEEVEQIDEAKKTTHEDPLITVHKDGRLHAHAHLSTINDIHGTDVKHTAIHAGGAKVKTKYGDNLEYKLSRHHAKGVQESVEQIDELSKATLGSYIKKASDKATQHANVKAQSVAAIHYDSKGNPVAKFHGDMKNKRLQGVGKATDKLTKEEVDKGAPFEGGREVKSTKSAAERVKKIAKGMEKHYNKDKK